MINAEYTIPGLHVRDHIVTVPLDWERGDDASIDVFAREVVDPARKRDDLPLLVYLQGGPGGKSPRPSGPRSGWLAAALERFRVILVDQRGTGRSSRVQGHDMARFDTAEDAARYLLNFRADSIVRDLEHLRTTEFGGVRWRTLGQSFGGFITLAYLSAAPDGLAACYVAGGLASIHPSADETYRRTYARVADKNHAYYESFPDDIEHVASIADHLTAEDVRLPDGDRLTVRRFQSLGIDLGMGPGAERLHWLVDEAWPGAGPDHRGLSDTFLAQVMERTGYDDNPLFAVLQESIYGEGPGATNWAAERERRRHPQFDPDARPLRFTGEMMYPWMFEEIRSLRAFAPAAEAIAQCDDYSALYDVDRLATNEVPVVAAVYLNDMFVDSGLSLATADEVGNVTAWVTNEFEHDGLHGDRVAARLFDMLDERGGAR